MVQQNIYVSVIRILFYFYNHYAYSLVERFAMLCISLTIQPAYC